MIVERSLIIEKEDFKHLPYTAKELLNGTTIHNQEFHKNRNMGFSNRNVPRFLKFHKIENENIILPRGFLDYRKFNFVDEMIWNEKEEISFKSNIKLKTFQKFPVELIVSDKIDMIFSLPGSGKTVMAIESIQKIGRKACVIVNTSKLLRQWIERIVEHTNLTKKEIGIVGDGKFKYKEFDITICMIQTLIKKEYEDYKEFYDSFSVAVFDESHICSAEKFSGAVSNFRAKRRIGITGSKDRNDNIELFKWQIGRRYFKVKDEDTDVLPIKIITKYTIYKPDSFDSKLGNNYGTLLNNLSNMKNRNEDIIFDTMQFLKEDRKIIIVTLRREHVEELSKMLKQKNVKVVKVMGGENIDPKRETTDVIVAIDKCLLGYDKKWLDTMQIAQPFGNKNDCEQLPRRIARAYDNKKTPILVEYIDCDSISGSLANKRRRFYKKLGYDIQVK